MHNTEGIGAFAAANARKTVHGISSGRGRTCLETLLLKVVLQGLFVGLHGGVQPWVQAAVGRPRGTSHATQHARVQVGLQVLHLLQLLLVLLLLSSLLVGKGRVAHELLQEDLCHLVSACCSHVVALLGGICAHLHCIKAVTNIRCW